MPDSKPLFSYAEGVDQRTIHDRVMLVTLGSFADAGGVQRQLDDHLVNNLAGREIGRFDSDQVTDYRDSRPLINFEGNKYTNYREPAIALRELTDKSGQPFLLLSGPEPSLQWESVSRQIRRLVDELDVELVVAVQGMPMPVPHTRPVGVLNYATNPKLLLSDQQVGNFQMSSSFTGLLAVRMEQDGTDLLGLVAQVPQYLADNDFPSAALAVLDSFQQASHLNIPLGGLPAAEVFVRGQIDAQLSQSQELTEMVNQLEENYDAFQQRRSLAAAAQAQLPDADEIGAEAEAFLASLGENNSGSTDANPEGTLGQANGAGQADSPSHTSDNATMDNDGKTDTGPDEQSDAGDGSHPSA